MQPVAESVFERKPSHHHLGLGVLAPDPAHVVAPYFGFMDVGHGGGFRETKLGKMAESDPFFLLSPPQNPLFADFLFRKS